MMSPTPAYRIETERLVLHGLSPVFAEAFHRTIEANLAHLSRSMHWAVSEPIERRIETLRGLRAAFDQGRDFPYFIFAKERPEELVGGTGLHPRVGGRALEIGYWLAKAHVGKGYVQEAAGALTRVAVELHECLRVEIHCDPLNERSASVARRLGYTHDATLRKRLLEPDGTLRDTMIWSILAEEVPGALAGSVAYRAFDAAGRPLGAR